MVQYMAVEYKNKNFVSRGPWTKMVEAGRNSGDILALLLILLCLFVCFFHFPLSNLLLSRDNQIYSYSMCPLGIKCLLSPTVYFPKE